MARDFRELLKRDYVILDGAMGTMLQAAGMKMGETPEMLNITHPELLVSIHEQYLNAGSDVIYANTFGGNAYKLEECGHSVDELVTAGIKNAITARDNVKPEALVALDVGPIGQLLEPTGTLSFEEAYEMYAEVVKAGSNAGADLVVFETMTDLLDVKAAVLAAKENSDLPIMCTMTFEMNKRTFTGCMVPSMALTLEGLGVDAIGVNCSLGPKELEPVIEEVTKWTNLPVVVKPNAGLPDPQTNEYNVGPKDFAEFMKDLRKYGIRVFGGCCGTNPEFIKELSDMLKENGNAIVNELPQKVIPAAVCSATKVVPIDQPRIIGERINPTGKKIFQEALRKGDIDYILNQALEQVQAGADILDVNVGLPGIDEREMMITAVKSLQSVVDVPLQLDSTIPEVLEAALRVYNGTSPSAQAFYDAFMSVDSGKGVACLFGNYAGDNMNVKMAIRKAKKQGVTVKYVVATDDVASSPKETKEKRHGIAGGVFMWKIGGAKAALGGTLDEVIDVAQKTVDNTRSICVGLSPCAIPAVGHPNFEIEDGKMEFGIGHHGEPGINIQDLKPAKDIARQMAKAVIDDMEPEEGSEVAVLMSGLGATPVMELYVLYDEVEAYLEEQGLSVYKVFIGDYVTSLDMNGAALTVLKLDDELKELLDHEAKSPGIEV